MITKGMAAALGVWLVGIGSASALVAVLNAPLVSRIDKVLPTAPAVTEAERATPVTESVLMVPAVTVVGQQTRATRRAAVEVRPEVSRDISAMRCGEAREVTMGSGHVQVCE
jgi:precorrin-2 methylase